MAIKNNIVKTTVIYGSVTYVVLSYLKMRNKPTSVSDFREFSLRKIKPSTIARSFDVLVRYGFAKPYANDQYVVTSRGVEYLYKIARKVESGCTGTKSKEEVGI